MINIGGNPLMILLAIVAALGGVGLYFVRNIRPELARDHDIFFSAIALVYGIIVLAFNFRMEITTQLAQVLVVAFGGWFAIESLVLRQALANQARRSAVPPVMDMDDEPPVSTPANFRVVDVEEDLRRESSARRMRGTDNTSELEGDVMDEDTPRRARRPRRSDPLDEPVIDVEEMAVRPIARRPRRDKGTSPRRKSRRANPAETAELEDF